jgi:hypothetical protein
MYDILIMCSLPNKNTETGIPTAVLSLKTTGGYENLQHIALSAAISYCPFPWKKKLRLEKTECHTYF